MNIFTELLFLFIYIITILYFRLPDVVDNDNYLLHKLYLFLAIFGFYYVIRTIRKIRNSCKVNPHLVLYESLQMALLCILGYSIFIDLKFMDWSQSYFVGIDIANRNKKYVVIASIIIIIVAVIELVGMLFKGEREDCINVIDY